MMANTMVDPVHQRTHLLARIVGLIECKIKTCYGSFETVGQIGEMQTCLRKSLVILFNETVDFM